MHTQKTYRILFGILCGLLFVEPALADKFYGEISALAEFTDNGHKDTFEQVKERQDAYELSLGGELVNSLFDFRAGYDAIARTYSEKTQEDSSSLEGQSSLLIGKSSQPATLLLEHSRVTVLKKPDAIQLMENQDEREMISITPTLRGRVSAADNLYVEGQLIDINYLENADKDSRRDGAIIGLEHLISTTDNLYIVAQQTDITFASSPDANYLYRSAEIAYSTKLRQISYKAHLGINQSLPEFGENTDSPKYAFELAYNSGAHIFSVDMLQELTDASFAGGNKTPDSNQTAGVESAHDLDRFERKRIDLHWSSSFVCGVCSFVAGVYQIEDRYLNLEQRATEQGWSVGFDYAASSAAKISLQLLKNNNKFTDQSFGVDYEMTTARIEYTHQFNGGFSAKCYANNEKRTALLGGESYSEKYVGSSISYDF